MPLNFCEPLLGLAVMVSYEVLNQTCPALERYPRGRGGRAMRVTFTGFVVTPGGKPCLQDAGAGNRV